MSNLCKRTRKLWLLGTKLYQTCWFITNNSAHQQRDTLLMIKMEHLERFFHIFALQRSRDKRSTKHDPTRSTQNYKKKLQIIIADEREFLVKK